jgi:hypothetical protein
VSTEGASLVLYRDLIPYASLFHVESISARRLRTSARASLETVSSSSSTKSSSSLTDSLYGRTRNNTPIQSPLSPEKASEYLSSLLNLPSSRQFPAPLALRILTHKSYRGAQVLGQGYHSRTSSPSSSSTSTDLSTGSAGHNARLTFLGKRAMLSYLLMFIHQHSLDTGRQTGMELQGLELSNTKGEPVGLDEKLQNLVNCSNLGRTLGSRWGLEHVMRWQSNLVGSGSGRTVHDERDEAHLVNSIFTSQTGEAAQARDSGALKIYGEGVQAVLGGTMMQFVSVLPRSSARMIFVPGVEAYTVCPSARPTNRGPPLHTVCSTSRSFLDSHLS